MKNSTYIDERNIAIKEILNVFPVQLIEQLLKKYIPKSFVNKLPGKSISNKSKILDKRLFEIWKLLQEKFQLKKSDMELLNYIFKIIFNMTKIEFLTLGTDLSDKVLLKEAWINVLYLTKFIKNENQSNRENI